MEEIIKRKNMIITKLKKDTVVLEQKVRVGRYNKTLTFTWGFSILTFESMSVGYPAD